MVLFRLIDFGVRVIASFVFVFLLQIQFDGKTLEHYLNNFGKKFFVTKVLNSVSEDGVTAIRRHRPKDKQDTEQRKLANEKTIKQIKEFSERIKLPLRDQKESP